MSAKKKAKKAATPVENKETQETPKRGSVRRPRNDTSWHAAFLEFFSQLPVPAMACRHVKISRQTYYEHMEKFPAFAKAIKQADIEGVETVEGMGMKLATVGALKKKFFKGQPIYDPETGEQYVEYEISESMIQFILKNKKPEVYGDKSKVELSGSVELTDEEVVARGRVARQGILSAMAASVKGKK